MIELKNISFSYSQGAQEKGLKDINLTIDTGEVILICGESGCGKTSLTRLINGLIPHYYEGKLRGEILIDGKKINELPLYETAKLVGSVFQNPRTQFFNVDTTSEIAFGAENMGMSINEIENRMGAIIDEFNISSLMGRNIFKLSGGEKQKIACASVSVCDAPILVLDEPSSNLDTVAIEDLRRLIRIWKEKGKTIIIAEHRLYFLMELADRIIYMKEGSIKKEFRVDELTALSAEETTKMGLRSLTMECFSKMKQKNQLNLENLALSKFTYCYKHAKNPSIDINNLVVPKGAIVAVIGNNGAGKSTFARCLCGLEKQCKGTINVCGKELNSKKRLKNCYMVMQDVNHQLFSESVFEEVLLSMENENETQAEQILDSLDLLSVKELHPMSLSGGQKQRVAIASAVASDKDILLFDEPTSGLDLRHMHEVSENLKKLNHQGKTLFIITHDLELILECCNHVLHIEKGKVINNYSLNHEGEKQLKEFFHNEVVRKD